MIGARMSINDVRTQKHSAKLMPGYSRSARMWARARQRKQEWRTRPVLREMVQKGYLRSTQEIEIVVGMPEKEMGKGTGTLETRLLACPCWARLRRFEKEQAEPEVERAVLEGNWRRQQRPERGMRGLYHGGGMRDGGEGYTNFALGRSKLYLERGGYLRYCRIRV
jgi:hypothetical protein